MSARGESEFPFAAFVIVDGFAGRRSVPVTVIGETATRFRVRVDRDCVLPPRRSVAAGTVVLVPARSLVVEAIEGEA